MNDMEIKKVMQMYACGVLRQGSNINANVDDVRKCLSDLIDGSHGTSRRSSVNDTVYDHTTGLHRGLGDGCFWTE